MFIIFIIVHDTTCGKIIERGYATCRGVFKNSQNIAGLALELDILLGT
jgi:hypothetical protein